MVNAAVPVSCWTDIDFPWYTAGLKFVSQSDVVSKKTVTGHFNSNNSSKNWPRMQSDSHLKTKGTTVFLVICRILLTCCYCLNALSFSSCSHYTNPSFLETSSQLASTPHSQLKITSAESVRPLNSSPFMHLD